MLATITSIITIFIIIYIIMTITIIVYTFTTIITIIIMRTLRFTLDCVQVTVKRIIVVVVRVGPLVEAGGRSLIAAGRRHRAHAEELTLQLRAVQIVVIQPLLVQLLLVQPFLFHEHRTTDPTVPRGRRTGGQRVQVPFARLILQAQRAHVHLPRGDG